MRKTLGEMLQDKIDEDCVNRVDLCRGLCTISALSKYLNRERKIDRLLLVALMQRLGMSADMIITLLSAEEYCYFEWRQRVAMALTEGDWAKINLLLEEDEAKDRTCNPAVQEQFYLLMQGIVQEKLFGNRERSIELLGEAIARTVPDFFKGPDRHTLLSVQEISIILIWQKERADEEKSLEILRYLERYVRTHYRDELETVKLYPKLTVCYLPLLFERGGYDECLAVSERAVQMMISTGYASNMEAILDLYVRAAEKIGKTGARQEVHKKSVQLAAWQELMRELGQKQHGIDDELYIMDVWQEAELLDEALSRTRRYYGYSQEELSEGICTPETLSRIENAKRAPRHDVFKALARKLSIPDEYYFSTIETDDLALLHKKWKIDILIMNREWECAEKEIGELGSQLDLSRKCNRQYIEELRYIIKYVTGQIPVERQFSEICRILAITVGQIPEGSDISKWPSRFWDYPFNAEEISVMIQMSDVLKDSGRMEQAVFLLEKLMGHYERSRVKPEFHFRTVILIVSRLSMCYGILKNYRKELAYSEEGIRLSIASGTRKLLPTFVNNKADALENLGQKETSLQYYRLAFYGAELFGRDSAVSKRSYEKMIGEAVEWY